MTLRPTSELLRDPAELTARFDALRRAARDDAALCVAHVARFAYDEAVPAPLRDFHRQYQPGRPRRVARPLDNAAWLRWLQHPDEDPYVGKVFETVLAFVRKTRTQPLTRFGLSPREAINPAASSIAIVRALASAARAVSAPLPLLFVRPQQAGGLAYVPSEPISTIAGSGLTSGRGVGELTFVAGHHMALYRPDRYVHVLYASVAELSTLFFAALRIGQPGLEVPPEAAEASKELRSRVATDPAALEHVRRVVQLFTKRDVSVDLAQWIVGVQRSALRAGLLLCGDLFIARSLVALLPDLPFDAMDDLVTFALSDEYLALRQHTGIALWPEPRGASPVAHRDVGSAAFRSVEIALDDLGPTRRTEADSVDIPLDELEAGRDSAMRSVEIALDAVEPGRSSALHSVEISLDELEARALPMADAGSLHSVEIRIDDLPPSLRTEPGILGPAVPLESSRSAIPLHSRDDDDTRLLARFDAAVAARQTEDAHAIAAVLVHRLRDGAPGSTISMVAHRRSRETFSEGVRIAESDWDAVRDPGERTAVGRFMAALDPLFALASPRSPEDYGFDRAHEAAISVPLAAAIRWGARAISAVVPLVFIAEEQPRALGRPSADPAIAVINPVLATTMTLAELAFAAVEHAAYERPERRARVRATDSDLLVRAAAAAHAFATRGERFANQEPFVSQLIDAIAQHPEQGGVLRAACADIPSRSVADEVDAWCDAAERTAARAAIATVFDLDAAASVLALDRGNPSRIPVESKIADLERFVLSDTFAALRVRQR